MKTIETSGNAPVAKKELIGIDSRASLI